MPLDAFPLLGDALWLDFVNSARGHSPASPDLLPDPVAFGRWCEIQGLDPASGDTDFAGVLDLRAHLIDLADRLHEGRRPAARSVALLNAQLGRSEGSHRLTRVGGEWRLRFTPARPLAALEAIARSAAATLADTRTAVRRCAAETCSLFFTDDSPTGSRRWCDPATCGGNGTVERRRGATR